MILSSDGMGRSGTFCALMITINRFKAEQIVDIFQTVNKMRTKKPGLVVNVVSNMQFHYVCQFVTRSEKIIGHVGFQNWPISKPGMCLVICKLLLFTKSVCMWM